jgi:hypothetical protein
MDPAVDLNAFSPWHLLDAYQETSGCLAAKEDINKKRGIGCTPWTACTNRATPSTFT